MKLLRFFPALVLASVIALSGCVESEEPFDSYAQFEKDVQAIDDYLDENNISAIEDPSGLRIQVIELGTGLPAIPSNKIKVAYEGRVLGSNATFDEGIAAMALGNYISGWIIGLSKLPAGSKAVLYIPSYMGYGNKAQGPIPANSVLVFDVDFQDIVESETEKLKFKNDTTAIWNFMESKAITGTIKDASGIRYKITEEGTGETPSWFTDIKVKLTYKLLTNPDVAVLTVTHDPTDKNGSRVADLINGLKVGLQKMKAGSKATFYIPSGLAYGPTEIQQNNQVLFPVNSNLIVDVELISVQ